jgi:hypothetical protein
MCGLQEVLGGFLKSIPSMPGLMTVIFPLAMA